MASFDELADEYARDLRDATDRASEVRRVARSINGLTYISSGQPLTNEAKLRIADLIKEKLLESTTTTDDQGRVWILKEADNKKYLELVGALKKLL